MNATTSHNTIASRAASAADPQYSRRALMGGIAGGGLAGILALAGGEPVGAIKQRGRKPAGKKRPGDEQQALARVAEIIAGAIQIIPGSGESAADDSTGAKRGNDRARLVLDETKLDGLDREQISTLQRFVADVNRGRIGIALTDQDGHLVSLLGNKKALKDAPNGKRKPARGQGSDVSAQNAWGTDWWGLHYYIDSYWTSRLRARRASAAISTIAGSIGYWLCYYNVQCVSYSTMVSWVSSSLRPRLLSTRAYDARVHAPWNGYASIQVGSTWYTTWLYT